jgi:hypothetical protein
MTTATITIATTKPERYRALLFTVDGDFVGEDDGPVVGEGEGDKVGLGEGDGELVGVGVTAGVGVGTLARLAVIVPGPLIVAVAEASSASPNVMLLVLEDHEENV